ncbi:ATP-binding protein [Streptacidiphilus carbonis]|uniref:ATP-binding protein n=1 Tax=Streptacidiphilus carbonis TaxID=105422 RepID=UPI000B2520FC|nr:ATP-binding protein [Streptacidiphilus carbonis]
MEFHLLVEGVGAPQLRLDLDGGTGTAGTAREAVTAFLTALTRVCRPTRRGAPGDVLLVVSELVTNAVRHAPGALTLCLARLPGEVQVTVRDGNPFGPRARPPDLRSGTGGFGWPTVQRLAREVRVVPHRDGKEIHAYVPWDPPPPDGP